MTFLRASIVFILCPLLLACGWHLRGAYELPPEMSTTYISTSSQTSELVRQLKRQLRATNINLAHNPASTVATLTIRLKSGRRELSISSRREAREYEVYAGASFSLSIPGSAFGVPEQHIELTRSQVFDALDVLAASREQKLLIEDMERQLAGMILDRISAAYANRSKIPLK